MTFPEVMVPGDSKAPINVSKNRKSVTLCFDGKAKDGTKLQIKAVCDEVGSYWSCGPERQQRVLKVQ